MLRPNISFSNSGLRQALTVVGNLRKTQNMENWKECLDELNGIKEKLTVEGIEMIYMINSFCIPQNLDFHKCMQNLNLLADSSTLLYPPPNIGTISITRVMLEKNLSVLKNYFSEVFVAFFPDIYVWIRDSENSNIEVFNWFEDILYDANYYNPEEDKLLNNTYTLLCNNYLNHGNKFETKLIN